ncbi:MULTISPECIES: TetR/AcrR family transcriptional regulator [Nocardia]|uniref:TetR/AcrR family transcriptional regulator n=1 Tax=Nocardia aurea TaxID=2144174 RepID=A0ABV3G3I7_9NOCA|nr:MULTISPECIES: TetR/AcrR family transcriptional regulator [Nocardia]
MPGATRGRANTDADSGDARARLVAAAVEFFARKGFHATTTRDIATAARMSPAALYVHHPSKEDLLYIISRDGHRQTLRLVRGAVAVSPDPAVQLATIADRFAEHHATHHETARIVNYELSALSPDHLDEITAIRRAIEAEVRAVVERGVAAGIFDTPDIAMTTMALLSLGVDVSRWYRDDGTWTPERIGTYYRSLALRIVGSRVS